MGLMCFIIPLFTAMIGMVGGLAPPSNEHVCMCIIIMYKYCDKMKRASKSYIPFALSIYALEKHGKHELAAAEKKNVEGRTNTLSRFMPEAQIHVENI